ncbi:c-type cytochrome [Novosphingobium album (ex Hu et al. 2023)]|uniref:Cytochrome c n=1 Tax=Novosphingobium album (ex Hu et al. 2023) TaxID=2930093 RepID=A0ABT0AYJ8_9SPHN|nr:cytochrome c [Novosphingobium album (ex Hu et al. 2023)]MCJ2177846.1 cytochrome c [Novosphingobium album (ex Hu et al. 2023)]
MRISMVGIACAGALAAAGMAYAEQAHLTSRGYDHTNLRLMQMGMGMGPMGMGPGQQGPEPMPRHRAAMMKGIPEPYRSMTNPLPETQETLQSGARVYAGNCANCHGPRGEGNGPAAESLTPRPGNLAWLADRPMGQWDPFIYWTVAEGGAQFGSAMPAFKDSLSSKQIWAVTAYVQAHFPDAAK